jgi:prolyl-tRNA editing enzyme YbaK/EbsC (Cys-tRNA(Pro) deacylase)
VRAALDIHRELLSLDVPHEVVRLRSGVVNADDLPAALDLEPTSCVAMRCYVTDLGFAAVAVHAGVIPDPAAVLTALGARTLRAADADEISTATDFAAGLVSPLGLPPGMTLLADVALAARDVVYCPAGEAGVALGIRSEHLLATTGARTAALSPLPLPRQSADPVTGRAASTGRPLRLAELRTVATRAGDPRPSESGPADPPAAVTGKRSADRAGDEPDPRAAEESHASTRPARDGGREGRGRVLDLRRLVDARHRLRRRAR